MSKGLLQTMSKEEVEAVLGHEIAHVANGDMVTMTLLQGVMNTFVVFVSRVIGYVVDRIILRNESDAPGIGYYLTTIVLDIALGFLAAIVVAWFSRRREFRADAGAVQLMGTNRPMINALARLGGMEPGELRPASLVSLMPNKILPWRTQGTLSRHGKRSTRESRTGRRVTESENGRDFYTKVQHVYPLKICAVQTDNGAEFLGAFDAQLEEQQVKHLFSYPRCPKINGCVERFQRTLNEEFLQVHEELIRTPSAFHLQLAQFLIFYNCQRAHLSLDLQSPMNYLVAQRQLSKMSVTRTAC